MKNQELLHYKNFYIGDYFIIITTPGIWNSSMNNNCPLNSNISYPYKGRIKNILASQVYGKVIIGMTEGIYGWSLSYLVGKGLIIHDVIKQRKVKLMKIKQDYEK